MLSFCNARQMTAPEAYITFRPGSFTDDGEVTDESTAAFLADFMQEFRCPRRAGAHGSAAVVMSRGLEVRTRLNLLSEADNLRRLRGTLP